MDSPALSGETGCGKTISVCVEHCVELFKRSAVSDNESIQKNGKLLFQSFQIWTKYTGAKARQALSLDKRLEKQIDLKISIHKMLHIVQDRLLQIIQRPDTQHADPTLARNNPLEFQDEEAIRNRREHYGDSPWEAISTAIEVLMTIAHTVRSALPVASSVLDAHYPRRDDAQVQQAIRTFLNHRYSSTRDSLKQHLANTIYLRRKRLLYQQRREEQIEVPENDSFSLIHLPKSPDLHVEHVESSRQATSPITASSTLIQNVQSPAQPSMILSNRSNAPPIFVKRHPPSTAGSRQTTAARYGGTVEYPPQPRLPHDQKYVDCPICCRPLSAVQFDKHGKFWKKHVEEDVEPFICLSERCQDPPQYFTHQSAWMNHMMSLHGHSWTQTVHRTTWYCDREHDPIDYDTKEALEKHLNKEHPEFTKYRIRALLSRNKRIVERETNQCPIYEESLHLNHNSGGNQTDYVSLLINHMEQHLLRLAFFDIPYIDDDDDENVEEPEKALASAAASIQSAGSGLSSLSLDFLDSGERSTETDIDSASSEDECFKSAEENSQLYSALELRKEFPGPDKVIENLRKSLNVGVAQTKNSSNLRDILMMNRVAHADGIGHFWPHKLLRQLITRKRVIDEFTRMSLGEKSVMWYANQIVQEISEASMNEVEAVDDNATQLTASYLRIFAILLICCKSGCIKKFIEEGVSDNDLPLDEVRVGFSIRLVRHDRPKEMIPCFDNSWSQSDIHSFHSAQHQVLVPYLSQKRHLNRLSSALCIDTTRHAKYHDRAIIPITEEKVDKRMQSRSGMFSCVKLHPLAHGFHDIEEVKHGTGWFAIKRHIAEHRHSTEPKRDILELRNDNDHFVNLLMSYELGDVYHLVFPWAECDLEEYFKKTKRLYNPESKQMDFERVKWVSSQIVGLASALDLLHRPRYERYVRHGNISEHNILWMSSTQDMGKLVFGGFGEATINGLDDRPRLPTDQISSFSDYRSPEHDLEGVPISHASDIWSFGCVLLNLICWAFGGSELLADFKGERSEVLYIGKRSGTFDLKRSGIFFDLKKTISGKIVVLVKQVVVDWMVKLGTHEACTQYFHDLLNEIHESMLVVARSSATPRVRASELFERLKIMHEMVNDQDDPAYSRQQSSMVFENWPPTAAFEAQLRENTTRDISTLKDDLAIYHGTVQKS